ncbi:hypothetical protein [Vibrio sp. D431a]|uniref:hypothetical protein n=1 Tax=Vibrio sp. D431a TaxID=2837388 RepID=UPI002554E816|nr:hypothetical protein [Vibrio sp. D431a]MDK9790609.1 hypothetical protein [Vibrio sp. D431a]
MFKNKLILVAVLASTSTFSFGAAAESATSQSLVCSEAEFQGFMESYKKGMEREQKRLVTTNDYQKWSKANLSRKVAEDENNLCDILAQSGVEIEMPDFSSLQASWGALEAMMQGNSKGMDMSTAISKAIKKGIEKATEKFKEGMCKLGKEIGDTASSAINEGQKELVDNAESYADYQKGRAMQKLEGIEAYQDYQMVENGDYEDLAWKKIDNKDLKKRVNERRDKMNDLLETDF